MELDKKFKPEKFDRMAENENEKPQQEQRSPQREKLLQAYLMFEHHVVPILYQHEAREVIRKAFYSGVHAATMLSVSDEHGTATKVAAEAELRELAARSSGKAKGQAKHKSKWQFWKS